MSEGTKNVITAMKKYGLTKFSACMSSFLFLAPEKVPKMFVDINVDHRRMLNIIKESGLDYRAILPPRITSKFINCGAFYF
jgi:biliverdin reductase / flavin reductase